MWISRWKWGKENAQRELPASRPAGRPVRSVVRTLTPQAAGCITLRLEYSGLYIPGQAVAVTFPGELKKRYYSLSSSPSEPGHIEITVKCDEGSPLKSLITSLKRGDTVEMEGPFPGGLSLPTPIEPLCFITAGTGVTPFRSMIKWLVDQSSGIDAWLFHSVKRQQDLLFQEEFKQWSGMNRWFHYVPTITQDFDANWINETGRINETLIRKHIPEKQMLYMLCGPAEFVKDIEAMLARQLNVQADKIRKEKWQ